MKNGCVDTNWQVSAWPGRSTSIGKKAAWHCRSIKDNLGSSCLAIDSSKTTSSMVPSGCCKPCLRREIASSLTAAGLTPQGRLRSIVHKWTAILLKPTACSCLSLPSLVYAKSAEDIAACQALHLRVDSNFSSAWRKTNIQLAFSVNIGNCWNCQIGKRYWMHFNAHHGGVDHCHKATDSTWQVCPTTRPRLGGVLRCFTEPTKRIRKDSTASPV